ncbi:MAG: CDP-diacylglycerol--glycerol-3-phosphate 3-phosphatidyltransferase [Candidatus Saccharibacteria bacterium]
MITIEEIRKDWSTLANKITIARLILSPLPAAIIFVGWDSEPLRWLAVIIFVLVGSTDILDGYLARSRNEVTNLGKIMDPIVDKFLILTPLVTMSFIEPSNKLILGVTIIIAIREISVTFMRARAKKRGVIISANLSGKIKMVCQFIAVSMLLMPPLSDTFNAVIIAVLIVTIWTTMSSWAVYIAKYSENSSEQSPDEK